ncbi:MAG: polymer-forming cytoskeletal protein [bacterium]|nr:polymer-forming cytoskeletal protein [bacterium]
MHKLLATIVLVSIPLSVSAAMFQADEEVSLSIPVNDDLYAGGGKVDISKTIDGDLLVVGGEVIVDASIQEDLVVVGGEISIEGSVGDDARVVGGEIHFNASTGDDLIILGGEVTISDSSVIQGDLRIAAGKVRMDGTVLGNVYIRAAEVTMNGTVSGTTDITGESVTYGGWTKKDTTLAANNLTITNATVVGGDLRYWQPEGEYYFGSVSVEGSKLLDETLALDDYRGFASSAKSSLKVALLGITGYWMLSSIFVMLLIILSTKSYFIDAEKRLRTAPWKSMWYGLLYVFVSPVIIGILFMSMIGIPIALFAFTMYIFSFVFIKPMASVLLAKTASTHFHKKLSKLRLFFASIGVYLLLQVLSLVPFIGSFAYLMLILTTFGVLTQVELKKLQKIR